MKKFLLIIAATVSLISLASAQLQIFPGIDESSGTGVAQSVQTVTASGGGNTIDAYYREAVANE
ncbi:MAG: hypothetical protein H6766_07930 [Candidatus Peribacteria bacterium]|nr:MAG: hypothetical protein H6766_07930 [Candidatus Peribacteria bacterium]